MIIQAANNAMDKHIPHTGDRKPNVIPGWDVEMDCARQSSLFWHDIWNDCGREKSGIIYDIMKKNRSIYHYKLRALRKIKHIKTKQSVSRGMLRNSPTTYWKSTRAIRKKTITILPKLLMEHQAILILQICFVVNMFHYLIVWSQQMMS